MNDEPLVSARTLEEKQILPKGSAYKLAKQGLIPCFSVGAKGRGVRFRISEVVEALRRPAFSATQGYQVTEQKGEC
jgi:hypothetical protein